MATNRTLVREFCAENMTLVPAAIEAGAQRIELCDNLAVGGTTPSLGVIRAAVDLCHRRGATVMCMVRPRGGDFAYAPTEARVMREDLLCAAAAGVDGIVLGCVSDGRLDLPVLEPLLGIALPQPDPDPDGLPGIAQPLEVTFHMAFDELAAPAQLEAIDWLAAHGVTRILTHGGPAGTPIEKNLAHLASLAERADEVNASRGTRIAILPGGGITWKNARAIAKGLGVGEVHGTRIVRL